MALINKKLIYPELSFKIAGLCFKVHNEIGRFSREKQYGDLLEQKISESNISYHRELIIGDSGNIADFVIDDKILLEIKAKSFITKDDYYQVQRYLKELGLELGLIINFRQQYLKPQRILNSDSIRSIRMNS